MKQNVMVVDDQTDVVETVSHILEREGYHVKKAYDGRACLEKAKTDDVKLVFLDIMMPGIDGYAVAKELRKTYHEKIKIVYISIKPKAEVNLQDVDGFIQKPFDIQRIIMEARKAVG